MPGLTRKHCRRNIVPCHVSYLTKFSGKQRNLVPRGRDPSSLRQGSGPLGYSESPSQRRLNLIGC